MLPLRVGPLVRATSADSAVIWIELPHAGVVTLKATPQNDTELAGAESNTPGEPSTFLQTATAKTVCVGNRYYAAPQLSQLQPGTWYQYDVQVHNEQANDASATSLQNQPLRLQCFRTLDDPAAQNSLTIAYGSCRRLANPRQDILSALGSWLVRHYEAREKQWPRLLLLIGDQIYADEPSSAAIRRHPSLRGGAKDFANFAALYEFSWTHDGHVRQALAVLPTYMICDDHEITNSWNTAPFWRAAQLKQGNEQLLVDGLVAYWVYQGWGNLLQRNSDGESLGQEVTPDTDPRLRIMEEAAQSGEDALEELRTCMRQAVLGKTHLQWYYSIPTSPPVFVSDARADREARLKGQPVTPGAETPNRIMSHQQMDTLKNWLAAHEDQSGVIVSSVPVLLPPLIGLAEYVMGRRFGPQESRPWHLLSHLLGHRQQKFAEKAQFDHWPVYAQTWDEWVQLLKTHQQELIVLSGDVHFSYTMEASMQQGNGVDTSTDATGSKSKNRLLQFVCSPIENRLGIRSRRKILAQSWLQRATYGGLQTCIRPLFEISADKKNPRTYNDLLFGNSLAFVTFQPQGNGTYHVVQKYMSNQNGQLKVRAESQVQTRSSLPQPGKE